MILTDNEEYIGQHILKFIKSRELDAVIFRKKYVDIIEHAKLLGQIRKTSKERLIFLTIFCVGQYFAKKSPKICEVYHEELRRCIDPKSFIMNPMTDIKKNKFIPENWNKLWSLITF